MTPNDFCYWLQGFFELNGKIEKLTKEQVIIIKQHLELVFTNISVTTPIKYPKWIKDGETCDDIVTVPCHNNKKLCLNTEAGLETPNEHDLNFYNHVNTVMRHAGSC